MNTYSCLNATKKTSKTFMFQYFYCYFLNFMNIIKANTLKRKKTQHKVFFLTNLKETEHSRVITQI